MQVNVYLIMQLEIDLTVYNHYLITDFGSAASVK